MTDEQTPAPAEQPAPAEAEQVWAYVSNCGPPVRVPAEEWDDVPADDPGPTWGVLVDADHCAPLNEWIKGRGLLDVARPLLPDGWQGLRTRVLLPIPDTGGHWEDLTRSAEEWDYRFVPQPDRVCGLKVVLLQPKAVGKAIDEAIANANQKEVRAPEPPTSPQSEADRRTLENYRVWRPLFVASTPDETVWPSLALYLRKSRDLPWPAALAEAMRLRRGEPPSPVPPGTFAILLAYDDAVALDRAGEEELGDLDNREPEHLDAVFGLGRVVMVSAEEMPDIVAALRKMDLLLMRTRSVLAGGVTLWVPIHMGSLGTYPSEVV